MVADVAQVSVQIVFAPCAISECSMVAVHVTNVLVDCLLQEQQDAIGLNLSVIDQPPAPDLNEFLADQMVNSTKAPEEYDPEELYDPSENM